MVEELLRLVGAQRGVPGARPARDSTELGSARATLGLLRGGLSPDAVARAVRHDGARVVHAHNLLPAFGWRALAAARAAGARVVLHLHQYRLVCAVGVCFTDGQECTRCHGRNTLPGLALNCRGARAEAAAYAAALSLWQRRTLEQADVVLVPSRFAADRLRELGAPLPWERTRVLAPPLSAAGAGPGAAAPAAGAALPAAPGAALPADRGGYALVVSRLAPEKGVDVAIEACARADIELVIAGEGPEHARLQRLAAQSRSPVRLLGRVDDAELARLRAGAEIALAPSLSAETFGLALAEAMAAGLPVVGTRVGALPELLEPGEIVDPGDAAALAAAVERLRGDAAAGRRARARVLALCAPEVVAAGLASAYRT